VLGVVTCDCNWHTYKFAPVALLHCSENGVEQVCFLLQFVVPTFESVIETTK